MLTQLQDRVPAPARSGIFAPHMSDAIALRNRFAMVKGAWDDHLRGHPVPRPGRGHRRGEDRAARAGAGRRDALTRHAGDRRAGGRRDVGARPRPARTRTPSSSASRGITRTWRGWVIASADRLVAATREHRQARVLGEARVGARAPAERERRAAGVAHHLLVAAVVAQAGCGGWSRRRHGKAIVSRASRVPSGRRVFDLRKLDSSSDSQQPQPGRTESGTEFASSRRRGKPGGGGTEKGIHAQQASVGGTATGGLRSARPPRFRTGQPGRERHAEARAGQSELRVARVHDAHQVRSPQRRHEGRHHAGQAATSTSSTGPRRSRSTRSSQRVARTRTSTTTRSAPSTTRV